MRRSDLPKLLNCGDRVSCAGVTKCDVIQAKEIQILVKGSFQQHTAGLAEHD